MRRGLLTATVTLAALLASTPASARYEPVYRWDAEALVKRKARVYVALPCRVGKRWYLPGDVIRALRLYRYRNGTADLTRIGTDDGGKRRWVRLRCLSKRAPDYSFRGRRSIRVFVDGLARDMPRVMSLRHQLIRSFSKAGGRKRVRLNSRVSRLSRYVSWVKWRLSTIRRNGGSKVTLRKTLVREDGWVGRRGEAFLMAYIGRKRSKALQRRLGRIESALTQVLAWCRSRNKHAALRDKLRALKQDKAYRNAPARVRRRLFAGDVSELLTKIAKARSYAAKARLSARAIFRELRLRARWR